MNIQNNGPSIKNIDVRKSHKWIKIVVLRFFIIVIEEYVDSYRLVPKNILINILNSVCQFPCLFLPTEINKNSFNNTLYRILSFVLSFVWRPLSNLINWRFNIREDK